MKPRRPEQASRTARTSRSRRAPILRRLALLAPLTGLLACSGPRQLVAPTGAHRQVARDDVSGVTVVLTTSAWDGDPWVEDQFTVVHVLISNLGNEPVLLAPGDFELVDARGFRYTLFDTGARFREASMPNVPADRGGDASVQSILDGEMARSALPWGVLLPGTEMRGFLYFDDAEGHANLATLAWHAQTPAHQAVVDFDFPLAAARFPDQG